MLVVFAEGGFVLNMLPKNIKTEGAAAVPWNWMSSFFFLIDFKRLLFFVCFFVCFFCMFCAFWVVFYQFFVLFLWEHCNKHVWLFLTNEFERWKIRVSEISTNFCFFYVFLYVFFVCFVHFGLCFIIFLWEHCNKHVWHFLTKWTSSFFLQR